MATSEADIEGVTRARGRPRWKVAAVGVALASLVVVVANELARNWVYFAAFVPYTEKDLVGTASAGALAALLGARFPGVGLWAGGALACVVAVGWVISGPQEALGLASPGLLDPRALVVWAAHDLPIVVAAGGALAAASGSRLHARSR